jgi:hypothetical protein
MTIKKKGQRYGRSRGEDALKKESMSSSMRLPDSKDKLKKVITSAASTSPTTSGVATLSKSASMRSASFVSPINSNKLSLVDEETGEDDDTANGSKSSNVFCKQHKWTAISTGDQTTVNLVVTEMVFPKIKLVDQDTQLMFSHEKKSICQYVIQRCNLHSDVLLPNWWKHVHKFVSQAINRLRNDRYTAMKWATLGKKLRQRSK